jgi:hypothetical protein
MKSDQNTLKENINLNGNQTYGYHTTSTPQFNQINLHPRHYNHNKFTVPPVLNVQDNFKNIQYQPGSPINRNMNGVFGSGYNVQKPKSVQIMPSLNYQGQGYQGQGTNINRPFPYQNSGPTINITGRR